MVEIRDAAAGDLVELQDVFRRSALSNDGDREVMLAHPEVLEFTPPQSGGTTRVALGADGRIVGFATSVVTHAGRVELEDLFVDPEWMRQGIGRALIDDVDGLARSRRCDRIEVTANPHALAFYESAGFVAEGEVETQFGPGTRMCRPVAPDRG